MCMGEYTCTHADTCTHAYIYTYVCIYIYMYIYIKICAYECAPWYRSEACADPPPACRANITDKADTWMWATMMLAIMDRLDRMRTQVTFFLCEGPQ